MQVGQSCPTLCNPMDTPWNSPGQNTRVGCHFLHLDLPDLGIEPAMSPALAGGFGGFFTIEPSGKPKECWKEKKVKVAQSCLTLCDPMDYTVHGIL